MTGLPDFPEEFANIIFYDNACNLVQFILKRPRYQNHFQHVRFPVDRFHFNTKHKGTHPFCQEECNPALFPYLTTKDGPLFNSSAAEQVMPWLGSLKPILRNMETVKYNFILNECVRRRNEHIIDRLHQQGCDPRLLQFTSQS